MGVPGTGTRNKGLDGKLLNVNLDQIVLLRFHALCLKAAFLVTILCITVILPIYTTTSCPDYDDLSDAGRDECNDFYVNSNLTDYGRTTLAHVPRFTPEICSETKNVFVGGLCIGIRWRLIAVVMCTWVIWYYCCRLLKTEWEYLLPMRRKYYLEEDFWKNRRADLQETLLSANSIDEKEYRDPWIPHPETRDTPENIELYSVLVGHLPTPPADLETGGPLTENEIMTWQLKAATALFDYSVPNQPGFSSSIAAITMLPSSKELAVTWKRWRAAAYATRRLRFIRRMISSRTSSVDTDTDILSSRSGRRLSVNANFIYARSTRRQAYLRDVMDMNEDDVKESVLSDSIEHFGPEQTSAYSIELARSASGCCPNGSERGLRKASLEELRLIEKEALVEVLETNEMLKTAQQINRSQHSQRMTNLRKTKEEASENEGTDELSNSGGMTSRISDEELGRSNDVEEKFSGAWNLPELEIKPDLKKVKNAFGVWRWPQRRDFQKMVKLVSGVGRNAAVKTKDAAGEVLDDLVAESTYAVVTFTSRQAAVAARQCLLDGRGKEEWIPVQRLPIPPLADAPAMACCKLVSLTIPVQQKRYRKYLVKIFLAGFYPFYSIPLTLALNWFNDTVKSTAEDSAFTSLLISLVPALIMTTFFAVLPQIFKLLANFGSNAPSRVEAEYSALRYYWYFMNIFAFWGTTIGTTLYEAFQQYRNKDESDERLGEVFVDLIETIGKTVPTVVSSNWLNWMIIRTTCTVPLNYMVFMNSFLFKWLCIPCLSRATYGGGAGGPIPYRIVVDSGIIFLTLVAVAPVAPVLAPFALVSFMFMQPLLRRNVLYAYRPQFDAGGVRWPFLSDILITCLLTGQAVLVVLLSLKLAVGPAVMAALPIIPTFFFKQDLHNQYLRAYEDAALLQTSLLDGWDSQNTMSYTEREEFRRFLVDCHKAAYIPACLVCTETKDMSLEPAEVVRIESDPVERGMLRRDTARKGGLSRRMSTKIVSSRMSIDSNLQPLVETLTPPNSPPCNDKKTPAIIDTKTK